MGSYVREVEAKVEFDGETIVARLKQIKYADAVNLVGLLNERAALISALQKTFGEYLSDLKGPTAADGTQVSREDFLSVAFFQQPLLELGTQWIVKAMPQNPQSPGA